AGRQDKDPGVRYAAKKIKEATNRVNALKNQLLSLGRSGHVKPPMPLDLNVLVSNLYGVLEWMLGERFELRLRFDAALGLVKADVSQIEQVIIKLVALIRDVLPQGGKLTIETANVHLTEISFHTPGLARPGDYAMVAVSAQAWIMGEEPRGRLRWVLQWLTSERIVGEETRGHLLEPFAAGTEKGRATWLGLVMAYAIVKRAGGEIVVESEIDRGTTFRMYLPLAESCALTQALHRESIHRRPNQPVQL
ncbi:MAG: ATP-binding protein, partial [Nitrospirales bacterium]